MELQLDREWAGFLCTEAVEADFVAALVIARKDGLRGADAIHLALALRLGEQLRDAGDELILWTSDGELLKAAIKAGIAVQNPVSMRG
jgi:predicted nucleic acid-binding protein